MPRKVLAFAALVVAALAMPPLTKDTMADVLVMKNGERVKTQGPYKVKGRQVIFTTPEGRLSSVRLNTVDLEASELATNPPPPPPRSRAAKPKFPRRRGPAPKPVLVMTNDTVGRQGPQSAMDLFRREVDKTLNEINGLDADTDRDPQAQERLDQAILAAERALGLMQSTCARYPSLVEPIENADQLPQLREDLDSCAKELSSRLSSIQDPTERKLLSMSIPDLRKIPSLVKVPASDRSQANASEDQADASEDEDSGDGDDVDEDDDDGSSDDEDP